MSDIIAIRVPKELKEKMKRYKINWSEYIRSKIIERILIEEKKEIWAEIEKIIEKIPKSPEKNFCVKAIREDREK